MVEEIVITDKNGNFLGNMKKKEAIEKEAVRAAVRVFVFNDKRELYLQKRNDNMRIAPGRWDQSCSGHIDAGETPEIAVNRELKEELGIEAPLENVCGRYFEETYDGKLLKSYDYIYQAKWNGQFVLQKEEIQNGRWVKIPDLEKEMRENPENFTETLTRIREIPNLL